MGVFDDKKFEELDWISQATEPIDSQLNEVLGKLPDEVQIDFKTFKAILGDNHYNHDLTISKVVSHLMLEARLGMLGFKQQDALLRCFTLTMEGNEVLLDFEKQTIVGDIRLIKTVYTMDEKLLEGLLGAEAVDIVNSISMRTDFFGRTNEIMELLGKCDDGIRTRSPGKKRVLLTKRLKEIFKTNEWKIKDTELANKIGLWIRSYIVDENVASLSNFCRLKVMTHKDQAIYSMEEVQ